MLWKFCAWSFFWKKCCGNDTDGLNFFECKFVNAVEILRLAVYLIRRCGNGTGGLNLSKLNLLKLW